MYIADETNYELCASTSNYNEHNSDSTEYSLQINTIFETLSMNYNILSIEFVNNHAEISGSALYGGLLDRCILDPSAEIKLVNDTSTPINGVSFILNTSNLNNTDRISSSPVRVCFCQSGGQTDCSYQPPRFHVMKGETLQVSLVAVDQVNRTFPNVTIYSSLRHAESGLGEGQMAQITTNKCTNLSFNVYTPHCHTSEEITLYADGPCRNATRSQRNVFISFLPCRCPVGFQPSINQDNNCVCDCDQKLIRYITNCSAQTKSLVREGNFWIAYLNITDEHNGYSYLTYPHCPKDYCYPADSKVQLNLNEVNGSDAQCANYRSGPLCGDCQPGFSLSLGSSRCISCSGRWPQDFISVSLAALIGGICLVTLMLMLNLTVAVGTLNGLIFCANIIHANSSMFFPSTTSHFKIMHGFIAWLNLDIGMDVCYFKGMDTYWKTWIQLRFPTYVILLVVVLMALSERSIRFTRIISKRIL